MAKKDSGGLLGLIVVGGLVALLAGRSQVQAALANARGDETTSEGEQLPASALMAEETVPLPGDSGENDEAMLPVDAGSYRQIPDPMPPVPIYESPVYYDPALQFSPAVGRSVVFIGPGEEVHDKYASPGPPPEEIYPVHEVEEMKSDY